MMTNNKRLLAAKDELIRKLSWNEAMGCHTKLGFEHVVWPEIKHKARFIVYFDVDGVHEINERAGSYAAFDAMIKQVLSTVRSTDKVAGQLNSGDEFYVCIVETPERPAADPQGLVEHLTAELARHNLTAVFAIREVTSQVLYENVRPAADEVLEAKKARGVSR